jgi:hypothetical protein
MRCDDMHITHADGARYLAVDIIGRGLYAVGGVDDNNQPSATTVAFNPR